MRGLDGRRKEKVGDLLVAPSFYKPIAVILYYGPHCGAVRAFDPVPDAVPDYMEFHDPVRNAYMRYDRNTIDGKFYYSGRMPAPPKKGNTPS